MRSHTRSLKLTLLALLSVTTLPAVASTRIEVQAGRSYMDTHGTNAAFIESVFAEHPLGDSRFTLSPDITAGWVEGRDVVRYRDSRYTTGDDVWLVAAGARLRFRDANAWYRPLFFSFQPAYHSGRTQALSSSYEFVSTLGWEMKHWSVEIRHISNGGIHEPNRGETMALVGIAFNI
ncbi:acyloxyacyl hydrolase [Dyella sp. A6]|uniref:acyloxyacyl hydrolase n=1 Tax=Dyella aluminiiresistens TaxID=3069105 RepID=UPI002E7997CA|nr:acyloxyacyl hydrolase [Dyella sp. A6]